MTNILVLIVGAVLNLSLGLIVLIKSKNFTVKILFFLLTLSLILWSVSNYFSVVFSDASLILMWMRIVMFFAVLQTVFFLLFAFAFPEGKFNIKKRLLIGYLILVALTLLVVLSPYMFSSVTVSVDGARAPKIEKGILLFVITAIGSLITGFSVLIKKFLHAKGYVQEQIKFLFIGASLMFFLMLLFNLILVVIFNKDTFVYLGTYYTLLFVGFTTYAIITKGLFNIKLLLAEAGSLIVVFALFVQILLSKSINQGLANGVLFLLVSYGGWLLVKSVSQEIQRRKEVQSLATKLEHSNADIQKANIRLKELDRTKSEFLSVASHELNSPMAVIKGYLHMILYEGFGKVDKNAKQYLERVYNKTDQLARLVADLLNVSRIEQGRIQINIQPCDIQHTLESLVEDYSKQAKEKNLTITLHYLKSPLPRVSSDPDRLKEIISNLLTNAVKFTQQGGVDVWVHQIDGEVKVTIKDTGVGIAKEAQSHIFEKFYRVDNSWVREAGGTGLGLYIVKGYLKLMNGKIWFESEGENKGTTFYFTLPIAKGNGETQKKVQGSRFNKNNRPSYTKSKVEILGIDKNTNNNTMKMEE